MKKIIRLNESDLQRIVNRVIRETTNTKRGRRLYEGLEGDETVNLGDITINEGMTGKWEVSHNTLYVTLNDKAERSIDSMGNPASSITNNNNEERYGTTDMMWEVLCSSEDVKRTRPWSDEEENELYPNGRGVDESRRIRNKRRLYETELDRERYSLGDIRASFNGESGNYVVENNTLLLIDRNHDELSLFCDQVDPGSYR